MNTASYMGVPAGIISRMGVVREVKAVRVNRFDDRLVDEKLECRPFAYEIKGFINRVSAFKNRVRQFYFEVLLTVYACPVCGGRLKMIDTSKCACPCGNIFDPTLAFQKSSCCAARLVRKTFHYACASCHKTNPSRFVFDEKVFDKAYFCEMMQDYRKRKKKKQEEIRRLLVNSRSETLPLTQIPDLESVSGLIDDLNAFIQTGYDETGGFDFDEYPGFNMNDYRSHIHSVLSWDSMLFSKIEPLGDDFKTDKVWRFVTLVFMQQDREVELTQHGDDILVKRTHNEAYA